MARRYRSRGYRRRRRHYSSYGGSSYCSVCGKPLSDPKSRSIGMGPECARKYYGYSLSRRYAAPRISRSNTIYRVGSSTSAQSPSQPSYIKRSIKFLFATSTGRSLLLNATIHALSPLPGMAPVVVAYDVYKAYKYAKMGREVYNAVESWRRSDKKDLLKAERVLQKESVDNIMERSQNSIMDMTSTGRVAAEPYSDMMKGTLSESAKHGFDEFAVFVIL